MADTKKVNYTEADTQRLKEQYAEGVSVVDLAETFGKSTRSIIAKLVREGVYAAPVKVTAAPKDEGPTKKEMLQTLHSVWAGAPLDGLMNATKESLQAVIALAVLANANRPTEDEQESVAA